MKDATKELIPTDDLQRTTAGDENVYVKPLPRKHDQTFRKRELHTVHAVPQREVQGPLVRQPEPAARLAQIL